MYFLMFEWMLTLQKKVKRYSEYRICTSGRGSAKGIGLPGNL